MRKVQVINKTKNIILLEKGDIARTYSSRLKGLLGRYGISDDEGLIIYPCNSVHTFGMKFPIDVIFVNKENKVCKIIPSMGKGMVSPIVIGAKYVLEVKAGFCERKNIEINDEIQIKEVYD